MFFFIINFIYFKFLGLKRYLYSLYIQKLLHCSDVRFGFPINSITGKKYIHIGKGSKIGRLAVLAAWDSFECYNGERQYFQPIINIGENTILGDYVHITAINKIVIGNNVLTGRWLTVTDNSHGFLGPDELTIPPVKRPLSSAGKTKIGDNVWIGDKVTILPGVDIGKGCIIGANSVVTKNIPPFSVAAGNPARVLRTLTK